MSQLINVETSKVHDFYHNTWSKQFCCQLKPHYSEIISILSGIEAETTAAAVREVTKQLSDIYPEKRFHYQSVYHFVNLRQK